MTALAVSIEYAVCKPRRAADGMNPVGCVLIRTRYHDRDHRFTCHCRPLVVLRGLYLGRIGISSCQCCCYAIMGQALGHLRSKANAAVCKCCVLHWWVSNSNFRSVQSADYTIGSLFAGLSNRIGMLIAARAVQGIGGAGLLTLVDIAISDLFSMRTRGTYLGIIGGV